VDNILVRPHASDRDVQEARLVCQVLDVCQSYNFLDFRDDQICTFCKFLFESLSADRGGGGCNVKTRTFGGSTESDSEQSP
jgi:hypothetical protein